jgi:prephenate dehydrogenase
MWADIFTNNKSNLNKSIIRIEKNISILKKLIVESDSKKIETILSKIQTKTK